MPFDDEPPAGELTIVTARLRLSLIDDADAPDAFDLLTNENLQFLDPDFTPASEDGYRHFARRVRDRVDNSPRYRLYQWAIRLHGTNRLVGLVSVELTVEDVLHATGPATETRIGETTVYIHPDCQRKGYAPEATAAAEAFVTERFALTRRKALIRWDNDRAQLLAARAGLVKPSEATTQKGYQTWILDL